MKITYTGPGPGRQIAATGQLALAGEPLDVVDDVAEALLAQDVWTQPKPAPAKKER